MNKITCLFVLGVLVCLPTWASEPGKTLDRSDRVMPASGDAAQAGPARDTRQAADERPAEETVHAELARALESARVFKSLVERYDFPASPYLPVDIPPPKNEADLHLEQVR